MTPRVSRVLVPSMALVALTLLGAQEARAQGVCDPTTWGEDADDLVADLAQVCEGLNDPGLQSDCYGDLPLVWLNAYSSGANQCETYRQFREQECQLGFSWACGDPAAPPPPCGPNSPSGNCVALDLRLPHTPLPRCA